MLFLVCLHSCVLSAQMHVSVDTDQLACANKSVYVCLYYINIYMCMMSTIKLSLSKFQEFLVENIKRNKWEKITKKQATGILLDF